MWNLDEPKVRWGAGVAHALLRAVSRLVSTPAPLYDAASDPVARTGRREESRRGTQECVRYGGSQMAHASSMTSGGQRLVSTPALISDVVCHSRASERAS